MAISVEPTCRDGSYRLLSLHLSLKHTHDWIEYSPVKAYHVPELHQEEKRRVKGKAWGRGRDVASPVCTLMCRAGQRKDEGGTKGAEDGGVRIQASASRSKSD